MDISFYPKTKSEKTQSHVLKNYKILLHQFEAIKNDYFDNLNRELHLNISNYLKQSLNQWKCEIDENSRIIDTCVVLLGVNISDHRNTFENLENKLVFSSDCNVIKLNSSICKSIKKFMEILINNIISIDDLIGLGLPISLKYSFLSLKLYFEGNKTVKKRQIVLIIEDVENFNGNVLENIIKVVNSILTLCPIILMIGISSSMETLNEMLTIRSLSLISIKIFQTPNAAILLNDFISRFTEAALPFQLGYRVYTYIVNHMFSCLDYSIINLINRYKYCLLEHVMNNNDSNNNNDVSTKHVIQHVKLTYVLINWLLDLFSNFQATKLGNKFYQLLSIQLQYGIGDSEHFKMTLDLFRTLTPAEAAQSIRRANSKCTADTKENIPQLAELLEISEKYAKDLLNEKSKKIPTIVATDKIHRQPSMRSQHQKELLKKIEAEKANRELTPFDNFSEWIRSWFSRNLPLYTKIEGYEAVYFDNLDNFKENINPTIKSTIEKGLINPYRYIKNEKMRINSIASITEFLPDTSIVYKLHLESPRLVNLYDILQAFSTVIGEDISTNPPSLKTQCRFMQSIAELQFLGFIKSNNRNKADHVSKLIWPGLF